MAPSVERYRDALREAERWLDQTSEPDVPHAAVVGQALSATKALDREPPSDWVRLLTEALEALGRRGQSRFGLGGDPSLLAAVLRGLDAAEMNAPEWLLTAAAAVLEERRSAEATAELADALARHPSGQPLVSRAVSAAFKGDNWAAADAPYARWWLASRRKEVELHLNTRAVDDAGLKPYGTSCSTFCASRRPKRIGEETYHHETEPPLDVPIVAFAGDADEQADSRHSSWLSRSVASPQRWCSKRPRAPLANWSSRRPRS